MQFLIQRKNMIFNLDNQGAAELRRMTGNYYAGNDFRP